MTTDFATAVRTARELIPVSDVSGAMSGVLQGEVILLSQRMSVLTDRTAASSLRGQCLPATASLASNSKTIDPTLPTGARPLR